MNVAPLVRISSTSHRITVTAGVETDVGVEGRATITRSGSDVWIDAGGPLTVHVPEGTDVVIGTASGRITTHGRLGTVSVASESGRIAIEAAAAVDVRTRSARVRIGAVEGSCTVRAGSGGVTIDRCGSATVSTVSGRIVCRDADGEVRAHCVSGRISIGMSVAADVVAETVSGRVSVRFPPGVRYRRVGIQDSPRSERGTTTVVAHSVSGRVEVTSK